MSCSDGGKTIEVPEIEHSIGEDYVGGYAPVLKRYFEQYYLCTCDQDQNGGAGDQVVLLHSNRVCLVSLAPHHPVVKGRMHIDKLDFEFGTKTIQNRLSNKVSGKGKKGGQGLDERSILCYIQCTDPEGQALRFPVRCCVKGKLVEINDLVVNNPQLIVEQPLAEGHIAVVLPKLPDGLAEMKQRLMPEQQYLQLHPDQT